MLTGKEGRRWALRARISEQPDDRSMGDPYLFQSLSLRNGTPE